jgi:hypothetical protein
MFGGVGSVDGVFRCMEKRAGSVSDFAFDPFAFEDHHGFRSLRMPVGGDDRARGKAPEKEAASGGRIVGKGGEFHARVRAGLPKGGVGETDGGEHGMRMSEGVLPDNRGRV